MEEDSWNEAYRCVIKYSKTIPFSYMWLTSFFSSSIVTGGKLDDITVIVGQIVSS